MGCSRLTCVGHMRLAGARAARRMITAAGHARHRAWRTANPTPCSPPDEHVLFVHESEHGSLHEEAIRVTQPGPIRLCGGRICDAYGSPRASPPTEPANGTSYMAPVAPSAQPIRPICRERGGHAKPGSRPRLGW